MLAGFERGDRRLGVLVPHGDDRHRIDVGIGEHVAVVGDRSSSRRISRRASASRLSVRVQSAASSRFGTPMIASQWISPNHPSPMTPMRSLSMRLLPQKSSSVSSRAMTMLPADQPAIDRQRDAGDRRRGVGGKEGDRARHIDRLDDAAERIPARQLRQDLRIALRARRSQIGVRTVPGQHDVGADAVAADIPCASDRVRLDHAGLGGAVGGIAERREPVDRADGDDDAAALRLHAGQHRMGAIVGAVEIAVDVVGPAVRRSVRAKRRMLGEAGIVDEDVDGAERSRDRAKASATAVGVADIGDRDVALCALACKLLGESRRPPGSCRWRRSRRPRRRNSGRAPGRCRPRRR